MLANRVGVCCVLSCNRFACLLCGQPEPTVPVSCQLSGAAARAQCFAPLPQPLVAGRRWAGLNIKSGQPVKQTRIETILAVQVALRD
jgi:hypothetical protein